MRALLDMRIADFLTWLQGQGQPRLRAGQVRRWVVTGRAESFAEMTDLPLDLRGVLAEEFVPLATHIARHQEAGDGTHKLLLRLPDEQLIECVLIQEGDRRTACISTQVGCGMGCVFCASGIGGVVRNLTTGEILEQLVRLGNLLPVGKRLTNVVVMGMGEPLANLDHLLEALDVATAKEGLGLSARHITISTVGLPGKMRRLAEVAKPYHLAVSLHAPSDELRTRIVPTNSKTGLASILEAADAYFERTGRRVTYEYVLLGGINDSATEAAELIHLLHGRNALINLIPFNDVSGLPYRRPSPRAVSAFVQRLRAASLQVQVRKRKGSEIEAACGQLRRTELTPRPAVHNQTNAAAGPTGHR
jgi:23S rRNA (adenine2503-C2)-methyltransferase